jgi:O-antigen ligase
MAVHFCLVVAHEAPFGRSAAGYWIALALFMWLAAIMAFCQQRPRFWIRDLLILTLAVLLVCNAYRYFDYRDFLPDIFVAFMIFLSISALLSAGTKSESGTAPPKSDGGKT